MHKNIKLTGVFILQLIVIVVLFFGNNSSPEVDYEPDLFSVADTANITKVALKKDAIEVVLSNASGKWMVNGDQDADDALIRILKSVMNRVEVLRPVSKKINEQIVQQVSSEGVEVQLFSGDELVTRFYAGGNENRTISYFVQDNRAYRVGVPGYKDYVSAIFGLTPIQWKERMIFNSSWRSVNEIKVDFNTKEGFMVKFQDKDLSVPGIEPLDTGKMMNYVYQFDRFLINEFVESGQFERYDSLAATKPYATLQITDIDKAKNLTLAIFPALPNEGFHLATDNKGRMMMIDKKRVNALLPDRQHFIKTDQSKQKDLFGQ